MNSGVSGPPLLGELEPLPGVPDFQGRVAAWQAASGADEEHAALREVLTEATPRCAESDLLLAGGPFGEDPVGTWLAELTRRLGTLR